MSYQKANMERSYVIDVADALDDLKYDGVTEGRTSAEYIVALMNEGRNTTEFTRLVAWLCAEIKLISNVKDTVTPVDDADGFNHFVVEIGDFLRALYCPHHKLYEGLISDRLSSHTDRLQLVDYLCSELLAQRIIITNKPHLSGVMEIIPVSESEQARCLTEISKSLDIDTSGINLSVQSLVDNIKEKISSIPPHSPLLTSTLTNEQWERLSSLNQQLINEYRLRREMLLKRLDVTIQSFSWSNKMKGKEEEYSRVYSPLREEVEKWRDIDMSDLLTASSDLLNIDKVCCSRALQSTSIKKVMMGEVPFRGGNPRETGPAAAMPAFKRRDVFGGGGGRGGSGGRGGGGGGWRGGGGGKGKRKR